MEAEVTIERYADQGRCIAHIDGRVVFVRFALPGERVKILLDEPRRKKDRLWTGKVTEVLEASPDRVEPVWPLAGPVAWAGGLGGADLVHVSRQGQAQWKQTVVEEQMKHLAGLDLTVPLTQVPEDEPEDGLHWRTRLDLVAGNNGHLAMRKRGSHDLLPLNTMPLASRRLLNLAQEQGWWSQTFQPGDHIRISVPEPRPGQESSVGQTPGQEAGVQQSASQTGNFGFLVNGKVVSGRRNLTEKVVVTLPFIQNSPLDLSYTVDAEGFWQVHRMAPQILVSEAVQRMFSAGGKDSSLIWDLYSGSGLFTLAAATAFPQARILSVEGAPVAVKNARENSAAAGLDTITSQEGDVYKTLKNLSDTTLTHPQIILLDPPRSGAGRKICNLLSSFQAETIIYISCNPASLARDISYLRQGGYELTSIHAYDIYPLTHHVETICLMSRHNTPEV